MSSNEEGYLLPTTTPLPGSLSLEDFLHDVIVGISGFDNTLVRPMWQPDPPKQPNADVNWIAFGEPTITPDQNSYVGYPEDGGDTVYQQRQQRLEIAIQFYGPNACDNIAAFVDGFMIQQNLAALKEAGMGYREVTPLTPVPDLINERWVKKYQTTLVLTRQAQRSYPILSFARAEGIVHTVVDGNNDIEIPWETPEVEE